jgi:UTP--glucose-1-phosphate uridylyltransferase
MKIRKAVIPAGGVGTRFLPASKAVPKELLPILDKPMIQYQVEEAAAAGIEEVIIVTSPGKDALERYFQEDAGLERHLADGGAWRLLEEVRRLSSLARVSFVRQARPLGLGHAVLTARDAVGAEPFVVMLPDDIIWHPEGATQQMLRVYERYHAGVVAVEAVPLAAVRDYGVVDSEPVADRVSRVKGLVEKPDPQDAPSNLAIVGRYVLTPEIFSCLERTPPGAKGEIQLTDGIALLLRQQPLYAYEFYGTRYDGGTPLGLLRASVELGLKREDTRARVLDILKPSTTRRDGFLREVQSIREELGRLLVGIDYCFDWKLNEGDWSAREVVYHMLDTPAGGIHTAVQNTLGASATELTVTASLTNLTGQRRQKDLQGVRKDVEEVFSGLERALRSANDAELSGREVLTHSTTRGVTEKRSAESLVARLFVGHWREHLGQLAALREALGVE